MYNNKYEITLNPCIRTYKPINNQEDIGVPFDRNSNSIVRRDHLKIFLDRRDYESVDEKSLSYDEKKNLVYKGLSV